MSKYKYIDPISMGYFQFKLTKKQHNDLFKYRKIRWFDRYEYYYNENSIILHKFVNKKTVLMFTLWLPIFMILGGMMNAKEIWKELMGLYRQKENGSFSSDSIPKNSSKYEQLMSIIKNK